MEGQIIDRLSLGQDIAVLPDQNHRDLKEYYSLLQPHDPHDEDFLRVALDASEYGEEFGITSGECVLLAKRGEGLNRKLLMTRRTGMRLFEMAANLPTSIKFTGIFQIQGETMNSIFKEMEMPAHDAWAPKRIITDKKEFYLKAYDELRRYLREKIIEVFGETSATKLSAFGMDEFFASFNPDREGTKIELLERGAKTQLHRDKQKAVTGEVPSEILSILGTIAREKAAAQKEHPSATPRESQSAENPAKKNFVAVPVKKRLTNQNMKSGTYVLRLTVPRTRKEVKISLLGMTENGGAKLPVKSIKVFSGSAKWFVEDNDIYLESVKKGNELMLAFSIPYRRPIMMEAVYHEIK